MNSISVSKHSKVIMSNDRRYRSSRTLHDRHHLCRQSSLKLMVTCLLVTAMCISCSDGALISYKYHQTAEPAIFASFSTSNASVNFTHVTVDPSTGRLYAGAVNWLYQFSADLTLEQQVRTGPVDDSPLCSPSDCSGVEPSLVRPTNNINKVLVIDPDSRMLLVCGSVHQGSCRRHRLDDIRVSEPLIGMPVAANDENSSTVAFVGPARYFGNTPSKALYVAASNSRLGPYRDMVPAISSRYLESGSRLFNIIEKSFTDTARVDISFHLRDYYLVKYIYGFHSNEFIYFATVQRKSHLQALEEWGYVTRLARVCASDAGFHSYTEITISCSSRGVDYNLLQDAIVTKAGANLAYDLRIERGSDVLIGVFSASKDHTNSRYSLSSAICIFPLVDIEQKFAENIHMCYNGSVSSRNMDYIAGGVNECPEAGKSGNVVNFCNEAVKLNGTMPLHSQTLLIYPNTTLTAITAAVAGKHTVAFLGTSDGRLKKVLISNGHEADEFEEVLVDQGHPILGDLHLDHGQKFVYVSSPYKLAKIKVERCQEHGNCWQCLAARNPYCGWCSLESRCTLKADCDDNGRGLATLSVPDRAPSGRWLSIDTAQCIDFEEVRPEQLPIGVRTATVELIIAQLPALPYGASYLCVFGENGTPIAARQTRHGLSCAVPPVNERPRIPPGEDHVSVHLAVKSTVTESSFIRRRPFVFYECSLQNTCRSCVTSNWGCNWCAHENKCTNEAATCSRKVIAGEHTKAVPGTTGHSPLKGVDFCPSFRLTREILIPNGARREISIQVRNLVPSVEGFECVVEIEGARERVPARVIDGEIICAENSYTYQAEEKELVAKLEVLWNTDTFIDRTNVTLYKCHLLGAFNDDTDCSMCQAADRRYQCVWCGSSCSFIDACVEPPAPSCPSPRPNPKPLPSFRLNREILIPNGARREIAIQVENVIPAPVGYECIVEIEGTSHRVPARVINGEVICTENSYSYKAEEKEMVAELEVIWNSDTFIDRTNVTLYKCHLVGHYNGKDDCSLCQNADRHFQCVWCDSSCSYIDACSEPPAPSCPAPRIDLIYPMSPLLIGLLVAAGSFFILLSVLILLAVFRHRRSQAEREYKIIQLQMGTLNKDAMTRPVIDMSLKNASIVRPHLPPRNGGTNPLSTLKRNMPLSLQPPGYSDPDTDSMNPYAASSPLENHYQSVDDRLQTYISRQALIQDSHYAAIDDQTTTGPLAYPRMLHVSKQPLFNIAGDSERTHSTLYPRNLYEASI